MFSPDFLRKTAAETGLIKRECKIDAVIIFWVLVLSFGVRLQRSLAARSKGDAAGLKIAVLVSAVGNTPESVAIHNERTNELKTIKVVPWIKREILLNGIGFHKYQLFARIAENGGLVLRCFLWVNLEILFLPRLCAFVPPW